MNGETVLKAMRYPKAMEVEIAKAAETNLRSFTAEVIYRLRRDMEREKRGKKAS